MDKRVKKSILGIGGSKKMSKEAIAKPETLDVGHSFQFVPPSAGSNPMMESEAEAKRKFDEWRAKYEPVEREIYEKLQRRAESKRRRAKARRKAFGDLCEMTDGMAAFCRRNNVSLAEGAEMLNEFRPAPYAAALVALFQVVWIGVAALRMELTRRIDRAKHEAMRPYYYEQEKMRRQALAAERRKITKRQTLNPCPTREEILDAWKKVKNSNEDLLRFGSLMEDLECYVDNSLIRDDSGEIIGRRSGIKGWLQVEMPALYAVYSRVMAYKAAAKRMRQIIELRDPLPLSTVLDMGKGMHGEATIQDYGADENKGDERSVGKMDGMECVTTGIAAGTPDELIVLRARAVYLEVMMTVGEGTRKQTALVERMVKLTDPDSIEDGNMLESWRAKYKRKITVRTKSMWCQRLIKMLA